MICIVHVCVNIHSNKNLNTCCLLHSERSNLLRYYTENYIESEMASPFTLPPLAPLDIHDSNAADKWKKFIRAWTNYSLATELNKKSEPIQVATLLTAIGEDGREVLSTFTNWDSDGDNANIQPVLSKFAVYCQPRKNIPFEQY